MEASIIDSGSGSKRICCYLYSSSFLEVRTSREKSYISVQKACNNSCKMLIHYIPVSQFKKLGSQPAAFGFAIIISFLEFVTPIFSCIYFLSHPVIFLHVVCASVKCSNRPWTGQYRQGVLNCIDQGSPQTNGGQGSNWLILIFFISQILYFVLHTFTIFINFLILFSGT